MSTDLPPEAYTKETLQAAFDWLQTQPEAVRASVHTPERLVSLFQRSQRLNDQDHPVSSKKFITDLKNLASSLDQFSGKPNRLQVPNDKPVMPSFQSPTVESSMPSFQVNPPPAPSASRPEPSPTPEPQVQGSSQTTTETVKKASFEVTTKTQHQSQSGLVLDEETRQRVNKVRQRFNLSSEQEALRLLVSLGYEKFTQIP